MSNQHEDRINTVMAGLREAQPAAGMEARVLARLRHAEDSRVRVKAEWLPAWDVSWAIYGGAAAVIAAATGALLYPHSAHQRPANRFAVAQRAPSVAPNAIPADREMVTAGTERAAASRRARQNSTRLLRVMEQSATDHSFHAKEDISFPAPPLPLTEQERLLLQLAHREPPQQLAQLTSAILNSGFQQEKEAVTEFFAPRPPLPGQQEPPPYVLQTGQQ